MIIKENLYYTEIYPYLDAETATDTDLAISARVEVLKRGGHEEGRPEHRLRIGNHLHTVESARQLIAAIEKGIELMDAQQAAAAWLAGQGGGGVMDMSKLTDEQKSMMLARLCGMLTQVDGAWAFHPGQGIDRYYDHLATHLNHKPEHVTPDFYRPTNMVLAWLALNWAMNNMPGKTGQRPVMMDELNCANMLYYPPAKAQRLWLDKILELAIDAGMVTE